MPHLLHYISSRKLFSYQGLNIKGNVQITVKTVSLLSIKVLHCSSQYSSFCCIANLVLWVYTNSNTNTNSNHDCRGEKNKMNFFFLYYGIPEKLIPEDEEKTAHAEQKLWAKEEEWLGGRTTKPSTNHPNTDTTQNADMQMPRPWNYLQVTITCNKFN